MTEPLQSSPPHAAEERRGSSRWARWLVPGDLRIWRWSLLILIPAVALISYELLIPRFFYTATDSVGPTAFVDTLHPHQELCTQGVPIAGGTGAVMLSYTESAPTRVAVTLATGSGIIARGEIEPQRTPDPPRGVSVPLGRTLASDLPTRLGTVCVRVLSGGSIHLAGYPAAFEGMRTTVDAKTIPDEISIYLQPPAGRKRSLIDSWPAIMHRLTLFRPGFAGAVFFWALFLLGLPLLAYFGVRTLALAHVRSTRRLAASLMLIAFLGAGAWAITTYAFDGPDESEHFAYTEYLAETGKALSATSTAKLPYASDELLALHAVHQFADNGQSDTRRPWVAQQERAYQRTASATRPADDDGGGLAVATAPHSPLYYALTVPGYALGSPNIFDELFWMRLTSALLATLIPLCAFLTLRELLPERPEIAVAAGLLVAFEPMLSFMSGIVNNDNGVNALAAVSVYLTVRLLRRGPTPLLAGALGITLALMPLMKATGFALFPAEFVALLVVLWRRRSLATLRALAMTAAGFLFVFLIWGLMAHHFGRSVVPLPGGVANPSSNVVGSGGSGAGSPLKGIIDKLIYAAEILVPHLPGLARHFATGTWPFDYIYVERGFASFGWVTDFFPTDWVYDVILWVMVGCGVLALRWAWLARATLRRGWLEAVFLLLVILGMFVVVAYSYYSAVPLPQTVLPEQGRYAFTALVPLVALALCGFVKVRRDLAAVGMTLLVGAMIALAIGSHLLYLTANFT